MGENKMMELDTPPAVRDTSTLRLGQRLRRARLARNMTQSEVAKNQFSVSYVSAVERGQIRPSLNALEKLAERLHVPVIDLMGDADLDIRGTIAHPDHRDGSADRYRDEIDTRLREARVLTLQGYAEDAATLLARLISSQLSLHEIAALRLHLAAAYVQLGRAEDARHEAQEGLAAAERLGNSELIERLRNELGNAYALAHNFALALESYRSCLSALESSGAHDSMLTLHVLSSIGEQYARLGDQDNATLYLRRAADLAKEVMAPEHQGALYWSLSQAASTRNDGAQARYYAIRSQAAYEEAVNRRVTAQVYNQLGRAFALSGQIEEARTQLRAAYEIASAQQDERGIAQAQQSLALVHLKEGRLDEADAAAQEAYARTQQVNDPLLHADTLLVVAQVEEQQTRMAQAERHMGEAVSLLHDQGDAERLRQAYAQYSEFLERRGETGRAFEMLKHAYHTAGRLAV